MQTLTTAKAKAASKPKNLLEALTRDGVLPARERAALTSWASTFYPFQRLWLFECARFACCNKSRQIGMSHTTAAAAVLWGVFLAETTTVISVGQREADEVIDKSKRHADALVELGSVWARHPPKGALVFKSGGRIIALPASSGGRSYSGNSFLDEFAYLDHPERVYDAAAGSALHGGRLRIASTPNGVGNEFHRLWTSEEAHRGWSLHEFPLTLAIADGMPVNVEDCWKLAKGDKRLFAQMFECSFLDGELQYLPTELILEAAIDPRVMPRIEGHAYAGLDIGLENDLTSLTILKQDRKGGLWEQETITCRRTSWDEQEAMIQDSFHDWQWKRLCVDGTGLGAVPAQRLQKIYGARIEIVDFTLQSKETLATGLYQAFADRTIAIRDDKDMVRDLSAIRRIVTSAGNVRYDAPRTSEGHADRAWSLALAVQAASPFVDGRPGERRDYGTGDYRHQ